MLFSAFTDSRPDTLLGEDDSSSKNSQEIRCPRKDSPRELTVPGNLKVSRNFLFHEI
jgi:hypothetical protein